MKRFTATEKWDKAWYRQLPLPAKCLWAYICDRCDAAGVWDPDFDLASFQIGAELTEQTLDSFDGHVLKLASGKVYVTGFVGFQYGHLSDACHHHRRIMALLGKHGIPEALWNPLGVDSVQSPTPALSPPPTATGVVTLEGKDKGKDQDMEERESAERERKQRREALRLHICHWFHRRPTTKWTAREQQALTEVAETNTASEDLEALEAYYTAALPSDADFRRRNIITLLNNWPGEIDKANEWKTNGPRKIRSTTGPKLTRNSGTANESAAAEYGLE